MLGLVGLLFSFLSLCVHVCAHIHTYLVILGRLVAAFLSVSVSHWIWVTIKPSHVLNVMCVNKYLTGDAAIMRRSHEVDGMEAGRRGGGWQLEGYFLSL